MNSSRLEAGLSSPTVGNRMKFVAALVACTSLGPYLAALAAAEIVDDRSKPMLARY